MNNKWEHLATIIDSEPFWIEGLNVWEHDWKNTGVSVIVPDPNFGVLHTLEVFQISYDKTEIKFAAKEFSNCVWGIFKEQNR